MTVQFFDITRQNQALKKELEAAVSAVIDSGRYILADNVTAFEKEFAAYCGAKFAVGVASGTDALHLALRACGVKEGDEVITSPFTFVATAEAIAYCGAKPVFVDIDPDTFNLDASKIKASITGKARAILPVHLYGLSCEMDKLAEFGLPVIEDCAQATGAEYKNRKVGSFGLGAFSFFPTKNLGCFGDGGAITTNDENISKEIKVLRNHGSRSAYHHDLIGYNSRLDEIQAAILRIKLKHLEEYLNNRRQNAELYKQQLTGVKEIILPREPNGAKHTYNQFTLRVKDRDNLQTFLKGRGIASMVYYPISLHLQKAFLGLHYQKGSCPQSEKVQQEVLSLPIFPELGKTAIEEVCAAIKEYYKR